MGCITSFGKVILVILNLLFLLLSVAFIAVGVILKFFAPKVLPLVSGSIRISSALQLSFNIPNFTQVDSIPLLDQLGVAFIAIGAILFVISFLGCCGACCEWRIFLILFVIPLVILVLAQAVVGGLFLAKDSPLHKNIREKIADEVYKEYAEKSDNIISLSVNLINYLLGCCGIRGPNDFKSGSRPASCCDKSVVDGSDNAKQNACKNHYANAQWNSEGCYDKLQDKIQENLAVAVVVLLAILLLQVLEIIFAILVIRNVESKVGIV